jgi:hypothetical protein
LAHAAQSYGHLGIWGCTIKNYYSPEKIEFNGGLINWTAGSTYHIRKQKNNIDFVTGCAMLVPVELFRQIGCFDPYYFCYFEDADLCERAREKGFKMQIVNSSVIYHKVSKSACPKSEFYIYHFARNRIYFNKKFNRNKLQFSAFMVYQFIIKSIASFIVFNKIQRKAWFNGLKDGIKAIKIK